jgi:hypothetical protein
MTARVERVLRLIATLKTSTNNRSYRIQSDTTLGPFKRQKDTEIRAEMIFTRLPVSTALQALKTRSVSSMPDGSLRDHSRLLHVVEWMSGFGLAFRSATHSCGLPFLRS